MRDARHTPLTLEREEREHVILTNANQDVSLKFHSKEVAANEVTFTQLNWNQTISNDSEAETSSEYLYSGLICHNLLFLLYIPSLLSLREIHIRYLLQGISGIGSLFFCSLSVQLLPLQQPLHEYERTYGQIYFQKNSSAND